MSEQPPLLGNAGMNVGVGSRDRIIEDEEVEEPREPTVWRAGQVMPPNCMRVFQSPRAESCESAGVSSFGQCVGLQGDGSCLLHIVRRAQEQGVEWSFRVVTDEHGNQTWLYDGPSLA